MKNKLIIGIAALSCLFVMPACSNVNSNLPNINSNIAGGVLGINITSEGNVRTIMAGDSVQLNAKVYPETVSQEVTWKSSNDTIATVSNGLVKGLRKGTVIISAYSNVNPEVCAEYSIIVDATEKTYVAPTSVKIEAVENPICKVGGKLKLSASILPAEAKQSFIWTTSNSSIATVSGGNVLGTGEGEVIITAKCRENEALYDQITITVEMSDEPLVNEDFASMEYTTHDELMSCEKDTRVKVKGVVTHADPIDEGKVNYYLQNGTEGYYIYDQDALTCPVVVGKSYEIGGYKTVYAGMVEIKTIEHYKALEENIAYTVNNIDGLNPMDTEAMLKYQNSYVSSSAIIESVTVSTSAFNFTATVNDVSTTFRVDPSTMSGEEFEAICKLLKDNSAGSKFKFKGIMNAYGWGKPKNQIKIVKSADLDFSL